jgi:aminoglycoside phosphotransferase family enzyme/predicted kinase
MISQDQAEVIDFLSAPSTHGGTPVERTDTHGSVLFLAGPRAWKLKRAVKYDYMDFSTIDRRRAMCEAEVRVNRRTAPAIYRGVVPISRAEDGRLVLGGTGPAVDWVVEMVRFDQDLLFDRLAARGALDIALMGPLASAVARLHKDAAQRHDHGGATGMAWVVDGNQSAFLEQGAGILDADACRALTRDASHAVEQHAALLDQRRATGFVRECHGDLHLRNIVLLDQRPTLFDAIEFNDELACTDVLYDLAFLLMDLWRRRLPRHANIVWNRYLEPTMDLEGIRLMPLFLSCRAGVRAKTSATAASLQREGERRADLERSARDYLVLAGQLLEPPAPLLIAVGGFSGSGKSTLAQRLAPSVGRPPGAVVIRSDDIRKRLCGVEPQQRLGPEAYTEEISRRVYAAVCEHARTITRAGHAAIADAVFTRPTDRTAIEQAARAAAVSFIGLWLDAPESSLVARVEQRQLDPSDADAEVVRRQLAQQTGTIVWQRIDASGDADDVVRRAMLVLSQRE